MTSAISNSNYSSTLVNNNDNNNNNRCFLPHDAEVSWRQQLHLLLKGERDVIGSGGDVTLLAKFGDGDELVILLEGNDGFGKLTEILLQQ